VEAQDDTAQRIRLLHQERPYAFRNEEREDDSAWMADWQIKFASGEGLFHTRESKAAI